MLCPGPSKPTCRALGYCAAIRSAQIGPKVYKAQVSFGSPLLRTLSTSFLPCSGAAVCSKPSSAEAAGLISRIAFV